MRALVGIVAVAAVATAGLVGTSASAGAQPFGYVIVEGLEGCTLHRIDLATGVLDPAIGPESSGSCVNDLAFAPDGSTLYGMREVAPENIELVRFDLATGTVTGLGLLGTFTASGVDGGLAFDAAGVLYLTTVPEDPDATTLPCQNGSAYCTYRVDPANPGAATFVGQTTELATTVVGPFASACDGAFVGSQILFIDDDAFDDGDVEADATDGTTTTSGPSTVDDELAEPTGLGQFALTNVNRGNGLGTIVDQPFGAGVTGFDFDGSGTLWGVGTPDLDAFNVYTINRSTGVATATVPITPLGENAFVAALAIPTVCLPELTFTG